LTVDQQTSPPLAKFDTSQECFDTAIIMQNRTAMQWFSYYSKSYLDNSSGDLLVVKEKITLDIDTQLHKIREQIATEQVQVPIHLDKDFFSNVIRKISCFALLKIKKAFERSLKPVMEECTCYYQNFFGLPCAHIMQQMQHTLSLDNIHSQWHLDRPVILPLLPVAQFAKVRSPILLQGRGRSMWASNNYTCRNPSEFELVENADTWRRCGQCVVRGMGHNSKTCPERSRIIAIQRPCLEEPAMKATSDADSVSLNKSCGLKEEL